MRKLLILSLLLTTSALAQEQSVVSTPPDVKQGVDPNTAITLTYGEMAAIIQSAVAEGKAFGAMARLQSQLVPKKEK